MVDFPLRYVHRPPADPSPGAPAVLLLHGYGADEDDLLPYAEDLPDDLHVLSVRGPHAAGSGGYAWMASGADPFAESVRLLAEFAELVPEAYDVAPDRIGAFGFSQGAKAALAALVAHPDLFRWAVSLHGFLPRAYDDPDRLAAARDRSVFVGVGEDDAIISPEHGERTAERLADAGLDVTFREHPVAHAVSPAAVADAAEWLGPRW